jgi:ABC-2 type transport system permease protein
MQLMGGKLLGHMGISLIAMSLYIALGLVTLASFSMFGLLDLSLLVYLFIFFLIAFFTLGSLMMAAGAAVNDMREAQQLMMPMSILLMMPWILWMPISRNPDSMLAVVVSFLPPLNTFGMLLRLSSTSPPPAWQVWLSIAIGIAGVLATVWLSAKIFRIGLLMSG